MNILFRLIPLVLILTFIHSNEVLAKVQDSVGTKVKNGKVFIVHVVENGQGLYGIMRRYGVPMPEIIKHNPGSDKLIAPGQQLLIPTGIDAPFEEKIVKEYFEDPQKKEPVDKPMAPNEEKATFAARHIVESGETLFSIAKTYQTTAEIIMELNVLETDELSPGQKLIVPKLIASETKTEVPTDIKPERNTEQQIKEKKERKPVENKVTPVLEEDVKQYSDIEESNKHNTGIYKKKVENLPEFDVEKITESGLSKLLTGDNSIQTKNVCSHYEALIGTIIMVTNPANNKAVFVKVISNFDFDQSSSEIILLSKAAMNKIGLNEEVAPIEVSYAR
jgi:LysM repeat protein